MLGIFLMYAFMEKYYISVNATEWPSTKGTLLKKRIYRYTGSKNSPAKYYIKLLYRYEVQGHAHNGNGWNSYDDSSPFYNDKTKARKVLRALPGINKPIKVYYDPLNHGFSIIKQDIMSFWRGLGSGVFLVVVGSVILISAKRRQR